jgi:hypothetical protein
MMNPVVEALMFFSGLLFGMGLIFAALAIGIWYLIEYKGI